MNIMAEPVNRHTRPDLTRVVMPVEAEIVFVVMSPSVRPGCNEAVLLHLFVRQVS